tara:strand:- start:660834 stop:661406 length:573 start_codon:yes stop_codon:yes gene_type:complete
MIKTAKDMAILERCSFSCGDMIITEGQDGNNAYLIQSGKVEVFSKANDREVILCTLGPGQIVGEMALVFDGPRSASVRAVEHCNLIIVTRAVLTEKIARSDATVRAIVNMLTKRIIESNNALLNKNETMDDLQDVVLNLYSNVLETLPHDERRVFRADVLPDLNNFLDAMARFSKSHQKASDKSDDAFTL